MRLLNNKKKIIYDIRSDLLEFCDSIIKKRKFYLLLSFFIITAYGFSIFNRTISIDDLAYTYFNKSGNADIAGTRWGGIILKNFFYSTDFTPFLGRFFSVVFLIVSSILFAFILYVLNNKEKSITKYLIFASVYTTYPLITELFEFYNYEDASFYLILVALSLIYQIYVDKKSFFDYLLVGLLIAPVMAGYESIMFAYITFVFVILYYKNNYSDDYSWFKDGLSFCWPLFVALATRYLIGFTLIFIMNLKYANVGNSTIKWFINEPIDSLLSILYNGWYYLIRAFSYFPIKEFVICLIAFIVISIKKRINGKKNNLIIGFLLILSIFFLSLLQGEYLHYRNAQTVQLFVAFVSYLIIDEFSYSKFIYIVSFIMLCVCLRQSIYTHELLALNNQRSNNEAYIARSIGYKIYSEFDKNKTVIFCGEYQLGDFIENQIIVKEDGIAKIIESWVRNTVGHEEERYYQEFVCTNINSYFNTQMDAFNGQIMLKNYLSYFGFDINVLENLTNEEENKLKGYYENIAKDEKMKPYEIKDMGDYILVYLGPTIDRYAKLKY